MSIYKIVRHTDGSYGDFGPNVEEYQPVLGVGDTLEYSDTPPDAGEQLAPTPPVIINSDNITIPDADFLLAASTAGDKTAAWLIAKLEL